MAKPEKQHEHHEPLEAVSPVKEMHDNDGPIWVNQFNEDAARAFVKQVQYQSNRDRTAPIVIYIDSFGGEVYGLFTMISALEAIPNQVVTVAMGKAMSAGAILLASGDIRFASPHSTVMVHEISAGTIGHIADIHVQHENIALLNEKILKLLAKYCKIKGGAKALKKRLEKARDLYLTPEEAVKFGLIDRIGVPTLVRNIGIEWGLSIQPKKNGSGDDKASK